MLNVIIILFTCGRKNPDMENHKGLLTSHHKIVTLRQVAQFEGENLVKGASLSYYDNNYMLK